MSMQSDSQSTTPPVEAFQAPRNRDWAIVGAIIPVIGMLTAGAGSVLALATAKPELAQQIPVLKAAAEAIPSYFPYINAALIPVSIFGAVINNRAEVRLANTVSVFANMLLATNLCLK